MAFGHCHVGWRSMGQVQGQCCCDSWPREASIDSLLAVLAAWLPRTRVGPWCACAPSERPRIDSFLALWLCGSGFEAYVFRGRAKLTLLSWPPNTGHMSKSRGRWCSGCCMGPGPLQPVNTGALLGLMLWWRWYIQGHVQAAGHTNECDFFLWLWCSWWQLVVGRASTASDVCPFVHIHIWALC